MPLSDSQLEPFDTVYRSVTAVMTGHAAGLNPPDRAWLEALIVAFANERAVWNTDPSLIPYRREWKRLRSRVMWLVAGAYLHVGYDLPRALADHWPGRGPWRAGPDHDRGAQIFFVELAPVFPEQLAKAVGNRRIVGWLRFPSLIMTRGMARAASIWVHSLRQGAWLHAGKLARSKRRPALEAAMADAMQAALADASDVYLWRIAALRSPEAAIWTSPVAAVGAAMAPSWAQSVIAGVASALGVHLIWAYVRRHRREDERATAFVELWGRLLTDYLSVAVSKPGDFHRRRNQRRALLGLPPLREDLEVRRDGERGD